MTIEDYVKRRTAQYRKELESCLRDGPASWAVQAQRDHDAAKKARDANWLTAESRDETPIQQLGHLAPQFANQCRVCRRWVDDFAEVEVCDQCRAMLLPHLTYPWDEILAIEDIR